MSRCSILNRRSLAGEGDLSDEPSRSPTGGDFSLPHAQGSLVGKVDLEDNNGQGSHLSSSPGCEEEESGLLVLSEATTGKITDNSEGNAL